MQHRGDVIARGWYGEVLAVDRRSPSLVRIDLGGPGLSDFASLGVSDEACVFEFPVPDPGAGRRPVSGRWYSLHEVLADRIAIGVVLHPGGLGSDWAQQASVGDTLRITHHHSWFRRPADAEWQLLLGDVTALPAFARMFTESARDLPTTAVIEVPDPGDELEDRHLQGASVRWVHNPALVSGHSMLADAARAVALPPGPGYVYVAGEAATTRAIRTMVRQEWKLPAERFDVIGYWRRPRG